MCNMDNIIAFLKDNPGSTAQEIGVTPVEMTRLAAKGLVEKVGHRRGGGRGRPPVEWALPGADVPVREDNVRPGVPTLPPMDERVRAMLDPEHARTVAYIEDNFAGKYGEREAADYALLRSRYDDIVRQTSRRVAPVKDEGEYVVQTAATCTVLLTAPTEAEARQLALTFADEMQTPIDVVGPNGEDIIRVYEDTLDDLLV